jgi:hypothetical protein
MFFWYFSCFALSVLFYVLLTFILIFLFLTVGIKKKKKTCYSNSKLSGAISNERYILPKALVNGTHHDVMVFLSCRYLDNQMVILVYYCILLLRPLFVAPSYSPPPFFLIC